MAECSPLTRLSDRPDAIPVTVLTGFLGSGKTTLLNHVLRNTGGRRVAVIENEFGRVGVDGELVIAEKENLFELSYGCACCTVRPALMRVLGRLSRSDQPFDHIVIETSGLADPAPVAQAFYVDEKVKRQARLQTVVTVVDAKHVLRHIEDSRVCLDQIAFADLLLLNKCDLANPEELDRVEDRLRKANPLARIRRISFGAAPVEEVLDRGGFDLERVLGSKPAFLRDEYPFERAATYRLAKGEHEVILRAHHEDSIGVLVLPADRALRDLEQAALRRVLDQETEGIEEIAAGRISIGTSVMLKPARKGRRRRFGLRVPRSGAFVLFAQYDPDEFGLSLAYKGKELRPAEEVDYTLGHVHDASVGSLTIGSQRDIDEKRLGDWLSGLVGNEASSIYRIKGILKIAGRDRRAVVQGVHSLVNIAEDRPWAADERRASHLVFIGRDLDKADLRRGFRSCLA